MARRKRKQKPWGVAWGPQLSQAGAGPHRSKKRVRDRERKEILQALEEFYAGKNR